ncbi:MAG: SUMF1/EgtB/PvdO family nonheme iron enzyme [Pirellulales bacterium]|nr:SUMF1/EgtB/PvdO family nonheme iron enzyme [Pirellulales bacterium]
MGTKKCKKTARHNKLFWPQWLYFTAGIAAIWGGRMIADDLLMWVGCVMLVWAFCIMIRSDRRACTDCEKYKWDETPDDLAEIDESPDPLPVAACEREKAEGMDDYEALVEQMVDQSRYALLLRPQIASSLTREQFDKVVHSLDTAMALVPDGDVQLTQSDDISSDVPMMYDAPAKVPSRTVQVQRFFLDRYPVTNRQYYEFVAAGGYEQITLWEESVLPAMLDFVDRTGHAGPRYWKNGCYLKGQENQPVVGICWYEALAYAGWVGKRLPTDAEWVKAGCWPVTISTTGRFQRRYPWGEMIDRKRANLWGSGPERIVDVDQYEEGVSVGGVYQLIGNVWEWTSDDFRPEAILPENATMNVSLKSIHGGAFDTYFDNQATCQFQSGESALARRHNIGLRLVIGVCDLALASAPAAAPETQETSSPSVADEENLAAENIVTSGENDSEDVVTEEVSV